MWSKIKSFIRLHLLDVILILTCVLSISAFCRSSKNSHQIEVLTSQISEVQSDVVALSNKLSDRLDAMQAQLDFIAKYSEANYLYFYGDVDNRKSNINSKNKK